MKKLAVIVIAALCAMCLGLAACGGAAGSASSGGADSKVLTDGSWECTGAISIADGEAHELHDIMNAYAVSMNFFDDNECRIYVDTDFTIVKWELSDNDITLSGEGTYHLKIEDNGTKLVWSNFENTGYDLEFAKTAS